MSNKVRWTGKALQDLITIREYIAQDNPLAAIELSKKIVLKVVDELCKYQNIGKAGRVYGTRELIIPNTPYIVVYRIKNAIIEVIRVLHCSMKWPESF